MTTATSRRWEAVGPRRPATGRGRPTPRRAGGWGLAAAILGLLAAGLWLSATTWVERPMTSTVVVLPAMAVVGVVLARRTAGALPVAGLQGILLTGLSLRMIGLWYRYSNAADALEYHEEGARLADAYRSLDLSVDAGRPVPGTGALRIASGVVHAVTFDDLLSSFAVFTLGAFVGCLLFLRAFAVALPDGDHRRYALLVMLWPALVFWPSSLGKEAWMVLFLGLTSLGAAHVLTHRTPRGLAYGSLALVGLGLVRPHVGLLAVASLAVAVVMRSSAASRGRQAARVAAAVAALIGGALLADAAAQRFQVDRLGTEEVGLTLDYTARQTTTGSAVFAAARVESPLDYPMAVVTVLFRPFPGEARTLEGLVSSIEAMALAGLLVGSSSRLRTSLRSLRHHPYLLYAISFVASFCYAFAVIGNFGILARQRTQVLPLLFVLVATTAADPHRRWTAAAVDRLRWRGASGVVRRRAVEPDDDPPEPASAPTGPSTRRRRSATPPSRRSRADVVTR